MPLDIAVIAQCLRHLEYPVQGLWQNQSSGQSLARLDSGYRFFDSASQLLFRTQRMAPYEESMLTGRSTGAIQFPGYSPQPGDTVSVTLNSAAIAGGTLTVSVTVPTVPAGQSPWTNLTLTSNMAQALTLNAAFLAAGFQAVAPYGAGPFSNQTVANPVVSIIAPPCQTFTLSSTYTGTSPAVVTATGAPQDPYIAFTGSNGTVNKIYGFLPILGYMQGAYGGETATLSASEANEVTLNSNRLEDRMAQYHQYQEWFAQFLGCPINPQATRGRGCNSVSFC